MTEQDLIKKAAEIVGVDNDCDNCGEILCLCAAVSIGRGGSWWNPLKDANHLNMVAEKLRGLGFSINFETYLKEYWVCVHKGAGEVSEIIEAEGYTKDYVAFPLTTLTAYVEAFDKWSAQ